MKPRSRIPIGLVALTLASIALALIVFWSFGGGAPGAASNIQISDDGANRRPEAAPGVFGSLSPATFAIFVLSLMTTYWVGRQSGPSRSARSGAGGGQSVDPSFLRARASLLAAIQAPAAPMNDLDSEPSSQSGRQKYPADKEPASDESPAVETLSPGQWLDGSQETRERAQTVGEQPALSQTRRETNRSRVTDRRSLAESADQPQSIEDEEPEPVTLFGPSLVLREITENRRPAGTEAKNQGRRKLSSTGLLSGLALESSLFFFDRSSLRVPPHCPVGTPMRTLIRDIKQISHSGRQLDRLVKTMDDFVFQANLLALEAAVESGRANQSGRGLITVAAKTRQLAICSAEAARNTADLVACVQAQIESGMEKAQGLAEHFIKLTLVEETPDTLPRPALKPTDIK